VSLVDSTLVQVPPIEKAGKSLAVFVNAGIPIDNQGLPPTRKYEALNSADKTIVRIGVNGRSY